MCRKGGVFHKFGDDIGSSVLRIEEESREYECLVRRIFRIEMRFIFNFRCRVSVIDNEYIPLLVVVQILSMSEGIDRMSVLP